MQTLTKEEIEHLSFIYERLIHVHGENQNYDYMRKFAVILYKISEVDFNEYKQRLTQNQTNNE